MRRDYHQHILWDFRKWWGRALPSVKCCWIMLKPPWENHATSEETKKKRKQISFQQFGDFGLVLSKCLQQTAINNVYGRSPSSYLWVCVCMFVVCVCMLAVCRWQAGDACVTSKGMFAVCVCNFVGCLECVCVHICGMFAYLWHVCELVWVVWVVWVVCTIMCTYTYTITNSLQP